MNTEPIPPQAPKKSGNSTVLIVILAVLVILMAGACGFLGWMFLENSKAIESAKAETVSMQTERDTLESRLDRLQGQYDLLREMQSGQMDSVIEAKNLEIEALRMQIRSGGMGGGGNAKLRAQVRALEEQLAQVKIEVEKLRAENATLKNDNLKLNADLTISRDENSQLTSTNKDLSGRVDIAKQLKISTIKSNAVAVAKSGKEKETDKSKKANKIESCFTVFENDVADKGDKDIYLVVVDPAGKVLGTDASKTIDVKGSPVNYTESKGIYFDGRKVDVCMDYTDKVKSLPKGNYSISVYIESTLAAKSNFDLR